MSAAAAALVRSFRVGKRTVTMTVPTPMSGRVSCIATEWSPDMPRRLSKREWRQYRAGRATIVAELVHWIGGPVLVAEI